MTYIDCFVAPLPVAQRDAYLKICQTFADYLKKAGALSYQESIADDVPKGEHTDFYRAVCAKEDETIIVSQVVWPDKATRDAAWEKIEDDPSFQDMGNPPFDGKRLFFGGFTSLVSF